MFWQLGVAFLGRGLIGCDLIKAVHDMFFLEGGICEVFVESGRGNRKKVSSYIY